MTFYNPAPTHHHDKMEAFEAHVTLVPRDPHLVLVIAS